ncbi:MAG: DUF3221 domain-containing protein [Gemmatimonadota bacterium]
MKSANAASLLLAMLPVACGSVTFPDRDPTIHGDIVGVGPQIPFGGEDRFWVKETPDAPCGIVFRVVVSTEIGERQPGGSIEERSFSELVVGRSVRVWARAVADSCPAQARADAIELIPRLEESALGGRVAVVRALRGASAG